MIKLRDVFFRYREGEFELRIPELRIARGDHVAVIGPSGSGKTTLLHLVAGIVPPERGVIEVDGVGVTAIGDGLLRRELFVTAPDGRQAAARAQT